MVVLALLVAVVSGAMAVMLVVVTMAMIVMWVVILFFSFLANREIRVTWICCEARHLSLWLPTHMPGLPGKKPPCDAAAATKAALDETLASNIAEALNVPFFAICSSLVADSDANHNITKPIGPFLKVLSALQVPQV